MIKLLLAISASVVLTMQGTSAATQPFTIPVIVDLSGSNAFNGSDYADTARAFEHFLNTHGGIRGTPIHFDIRDSETSPQTALQLAQQLIAQQLIAQHPSVVIGPGQIGQCAAVAPAMESGPVDYCLSPGLNPKPGGYVFSTSVALAYIQPSMIRFVRLKGYRRLAMISTTDASGQANEQATVDALNKPENKGLSVVAAQHFNANDPTASAQIANVKSANPDAIIIWANGTAFGTVLRNLKDAGMDVPVITSGSNLNQRVMAQFANVLPSTMLFNGIVYFGRNDLSSGPLRTRIDEFYSAFKAINKTATPSSGYAWDPLLIVADALNHLDTSATAVQIRDYILHLHGFVGISGVYNFQNDNHGLTDKSVIMVRWDAAKNSFFAVSRGGGTPLKS